MRRHKHTSATALPAQPTVCSELDYCKLTTDEQRPSLTHKTELKIDQKTRTTNKKSTTRYGDCIRKLTDIRTSTSDTFDCVRGTGPVCKSSAQSRICHVGHSVRLTAVTRSFRGQTRPSASEVSPSRLLSSGTHFHLTSAHRSTVADNSDQS